MYQGCEFVGGMMLDDINDKNKGIIKSAAENLKAVIDQFCPDSRERSIAYTKVDEAVLWSHHHIDIMKGKRITRGDGKKSRNGI